MSTEATVESLVARQRVHHDHDPVHLRTSKHVVAPPRVVRRWRALPYAVIVIVVGLLAITNIEHAPGFQDDEGIYTFQARAIWEGALAPYTYWYDHPPVGWMQLAAVAWIPPLFDSTLAAVSTMRYVIAGYLVLTAVLLYALARRVGMRVGLSLLGVALFVANPLTLELARMVFLDSVAMPWILAAFFFAMSPKHNLGAHMLAGAFFAIGVLSKETLAVYGPALLFVLWRNSHDRNQSFSILGFLTSGALILAFYPLMAILRGELFAHPDRATLFEALKWQFADREGSGHLWEAGSGRQELMEAWLGVDPYLPIAGVVAALLLAASPRYRWLTLAMAVYAIPIVAMDGYLPAMHIVTVLPFLALSVVSALDCVWAWGTRQRGRVVRVGTSLAAGAASMGLIAVATLSWQERVDGMLTTKQNTDWFSTVAWVKDNIPRDQVIAVPPSMWQEFKDAGWKDEWSVVAGEKIDLDPLEFNKAHPEGWRAVDYVVISSQILDNLENLDLKKLSEALEYGTPVATFGANQVVRIDAPAYVRPLHPLVTE